MLNTILEKEIRPGTYSATIDSYELVTPQNGKEYIKITMYVDDVCVIDRIYESRCKYFMYQIRAQFDLMYEDVTLVQLLELAKSTPICFTAELHPQYGLQINYSVS